MNLHLKRTRSRPVMGLMPAAAAIAATAVAATALAAIPLVDSSSFNPTVDFRTDSGAAIYQQICQGCHMPLGEGAVGAGHYPRLAGDRALKSWEYVALTVLGGRNGMPAFGLPENQAAQVLSVHLSDAQVADIVNYVRSHFGNAYKKSVTALKVSALPHPASPSLP